MRKKYNIISLLITFVMTISFLNFRVSAAENSIDEVRHLIKDYYVTEVSDSILNKATIKEIVSGLNDPYTEYFSKQQQQDFINLIDNKTYGIGIYMEIIPEGVRINGVMENSPAYKIGIKAGDIIINADGRSLAGVNAEQASTYIKGKVGTKVNLTIKREGLKLTFNVDRAEITLPTVGAKMLNNTAYIQIASFGEDTSELFTEKLMEMRNQNPDNYIIDLRSNGGGYMASAIDIAGHFIGRKPAIIVENKDGNREGFLATQKDFVIDKPIIFLTDKYTASSSEILSAAVKDYEKAYFIGSNTYGKGVAQQMFDLSDGGSLKLTVEKFYSPKGRIIQKVGISPDFKVESVDSLAVAQLFSGKCRNKENKTGYVKVDIDGKQFELDLNLAKDEKYWKAFQYIINKTPKDKVFIGTKQGWKVATADYFDNMYKFLYGKLDTLETSKDVPNNKVFTVNFNKKVNIDELKNKVDIQIINEQTGQRAAFDMTQKEDNSISLVPKEILKSGESYYIKVKNTIKKFIVANDEKK